MPNAKWKSIRRLHYLRWGGRLKGADGVACWTLTLPCVGRLGVTGCCGCGC